MERIFAFKRGALPIGAKTYLMGIVNYTPDSFSDGALFFTPEKAAEHARRLAAEGADLIDLGCCSTRPGGAAADAKTELLRLKEALPAVRRAVDLPLSVDTFRPAVAAAALEMGADIINDVGGAVSPEMALVVKRAGAGWVLMHAGAGADAGAECEYPAGVAAAVQRFFDGAVESAAAFGIAPSRLCLDPGFGFGKNAAQNLELLRELASLQTGDCALLVALSRKRFVGAISGETDPTERTGGTLAADLAAVSKGADILRVHDVAAHAAAVRAADKIWRNA